MKYEIDKKSFYQMTRDLFNYIYGGDYVTLSSSNFEDYELIDQEAYDIIYEEYYLEDKEGRKIFYNKSKLNAKKKCVNTFVDCGTYENKVFEVNSEKNEILDLVYPEMIEYPFLDNLPRLIDYLALTKEYDEPLKFDEKLTSAICEVFREYKIKDENNKNNMMLKLRQRINENE